MRCIDAKWSMRDLYCNRMNRSKRMREHRQEKRSVDTHIKFPRICKID